MISRNLAILGCSLIMLGAQCAAHTIQVCIPINPFPPLTFPTHEGQGQYLVRKAIERQGHSVQFTAVPWLRCTEGAANGTYDAAMPPSAMFLGTLAFPMRGGQVDAQIAVGDATISVLRRVGSSADWDGTRFTNLTRPVMYNRGIVSIKNKLAKLEVAGDDAVHANESLLRKLLVGRSEMAIMNTQAAAMELADEEFRGKLELLPAPFLTFTLYVAFNPRYYSQNSALVDAIWSDIGRQKASPEWAKIAHSLAK
jgi:polar amino acid transport system substrate-binding protein